MKKILITLLIFSIVYTANAQNPVIVNRASQANTVQDARLAAQYNFILPRFDDTTTANLNKGLDSCGAKIFTRNDNSEWFRQCSPKAWILVRSSNNTSAGTVCGISGGYVTWSGTGLVSDISRATYCINERQFSYPGGAVTHSAAHSTLNRFDAIYLDTLGQAGVITGTPGANPGVPTVNPLSQFYLTAIYIPAAATVPGGVSQTLIYDENAGAPTEWPGSSTGSATLVFNSSAQAQHGTLSTSIVGTSGQSEVITYATGTPVNYTQSNSLKLFARIGTAVKPNEAIVTVSFLLGSNTLQVPINIKDFGFNTTLANTWQNITIPMSAFTAIAGTGVMADGVRFNVTFRTGNTIYIDHITLQGGVQQPGTGGNYISDIRRIPGNDTVQAQINGIWYNKFIDSIGSGGGGATKYVLKGNNILIDSSVANTYRVAADTTDNHLATQWYVDSSVVAAGGITSDSLRKAIPRAGTASDGGGNITGDLEFTGERSLVGYNGDGYSRFLINQTDLTVTMDRQNLAGNRAQGITIDSDDGIEINVTGGSGRGLIGLQDFSPNIGPLDYTQKIYVDRKADSIRGEMNYKGYFSTATGITLDETHQIVNVTATGQTITLPTAVGIAGRTYTIKLTGSGTGTVNTTSSQNIDGSTTYSLSAQYKYVTVQSTGAEWIVIANN